MIYILRLICGHIYVRVDLERVESDSFINDMLNLVFGVKNTFIGPRRVRARWCRPYSLLRAGEKDEAPAIGEEAEFKKKNLSLSGEGSQFLWRCSAACTWDARIWKQ